MKGYLECKKEQGPRLKILPAIFSPNDLEQKAVWESFVKLFVVQLSLGLTLWQGAGFSLSD